MKSLFIKLYDLITEPLYRRLSRELALQAQSLTQAQLEYQERIAKKLVDEMLRINLILQNQAGQSDIRSFLSEEAGAEYDDLSNTEVAAVVKDLDKTLGAIEVCRKHQLPIAAVLDIQSKFSGMDAASVRRARRLEQEKEELLEIVSNLKQENKRLRATSD